MLGIDGFLDRTVVGWLGGREGKIPGWMTRRDFFRPLPPGFGLGHEPKELFRQEPDQLSEEKRAETPLRQRDLRVAFWR
ncbi:MAG: hypothetical protein CMO40_00875 [Verrucomicrobiaceae bacterium]|nr:hypothetical protein [Verrucomicrobiaceae bacterium]